jgi:DNA-directed RNA polymerase specialized sigma24 family protein
VRDRVRSTRTIARREAAAASGASAARSNRAPTLDAIRAEHAALLERELQRLSHTDAAIIRGLLAGLTHDDAAKRVGRSSKTAQRAMRKLQSTITKRLQPAHRDF